MKSLVEQAKASGKPQEIAEKMVEGRMKKYYQEVVLLEQTSVVDGETRIADFVANVSKEIGADIALTAFVRFNLGEGIEKEETDFAAELPHNCPSTRPRGDNPWQTVKL